MSGSNKRIFDDDAALRLKQEREAGWSVIALSGRYSCSTVTIWSTLKRAGYVQRPILTEAQILEARTLYEKKMWSLSRVGEKYGVSAGAIRKRLVQRGVVLRSHGPQPMAVGQRKIGTITGKMALMLKKKGWSLKRIATKAGVSFQSVSEALKPYSGG